MWKNWGGNRVVVFNATFKNISDILLVEKTELVPRENQQPAASHWEILSHNVVSSIPCHKQD